MRLLAVFFLIYLVAVSYPGILPFNRIEPLVLGLPFSFVWMILWVVLGWVALLLRYRADRRSES
jgi:hypothetical protein